MSNNQENDIGDIGSLDKIDFGAIEAKVEEMQKGGGEVVEASNTCDSGGCII